MTVDANVSHGFGARLDRRGGGPGVGLPAQLLASDLQLQAAGSLSAACS
jgi:hypothetical protein